MSDNGYSQRPISEDELHAARQMRHKLLQDPYRPAYHFVAPEGHAMPFDPNGNVFWRGRHHLGYIYQERGVHLWGHVSSVDLLHWRHHTPYLLPTLDSPETGIFSGNSFVDRDGSRVLCLYHGCDAGNCLAWSDDPDLENWHKLPGNPIVPNPVEPEKADYTSWDPCGWILGDTYYAVFGGKKNTVWKSRDLKDWTRCGPFLAHAYPGVDLDEDISCPDFFPMGDKWVMLCISHRLGARYYVGRWENEQLHAEYHERLSHSDNEYFAPESHTDDRSRRILFAWVFDGRSDQVRGAAGWSGMMALPRTITLESDNRLLMQPVEELQRLRYNGTTREGLAVPTDAEVPISFDAVTPNVLELEVELANDGATELGIKVCCTPDNSDETVIGYEVSEGRLRIDTTRTGPNRKKARPVTNAAAGVIEAAPLKLGRNEPLKLRVFVDRCLVEVFANDGRLALSRVVYPAAEATGIRLYAGGGAATARIVKVWDLMPTNPY
jgi:beta-fructofuranosidase